MASKILGIGTAAPSCRVTQEEACRVAIALTAASPSQAARLESLYRQTQIEARHMVSGSSMLDCSLDAIRAGNTRSYSFQDVANGASTLTLDAPVICDLEAAPTTGERMAMYRRESPPLAETAARAAFEDADISPSTITHLVTASCTGFAAPGVDVELIKMLPLSPRVERTHIGYMGCHGAFNALRVARAIVNADPKARVLVCSVELCSLHYQFVWNTEHMIANALFADGAGAFIVANEPEVADDWILAGSGGVVIPDSEEAMTWTISDAGFEMTLSKAVPRLIERELRPWLEDWLRPFGVGVAGVKTWAVHPGGPRILTAVETALGLSEHALDSSRSVLRDFGNMSSATIAFVLKRLRDAGAPRPCVALGFGPGLATEAMLFR